MAEYEKEHNEAASDIAAYVSNPINAYLLTKRLTSDWRVIEQVMVHDAGSGMYIFQLCQLSYILIHWAHFLIRTFVFFLFPFDFLALWNVQ